MCSYAFACVCVPTYLCLESVGAQSTLEDEMQPIVVLHERRDQLRRINTHTCIPCHAHISEMMFDAVYSRISAHQAAKPRSSQYVFYRHRRLRPGAWDLRPTQGVTYLELRLESRHVLQILRIEKLTCGHLSTTDHQNKSPRQ